MNVHAEVIEPLAAYVLDACDSTEEAAAIEAHLAECASCAAEADRLRAAAAWIGVDRAVPPPARLRDTVLARAREARPPSPFRTLIEAYAIQVKRLDRLLARIDEPDWHRSDPRHDDLAGVVVHLAGNDAQLAADLDLPVIPRGRGGTREGWRAQADALLSLEDADLEHPVRLAGNDGPQPGVLRDALVQRAFETWTHLEDVSNLAGQPAPPPPPEQVRRIVGLAAGLLPEALRHHGISAPGSARLVLTGPAGGEWTIPLGDTSQPPVLTVTADAVEFARLVANRRSAGTLRHTVTGDGPLATHLLRIAATLGCD
jgi:putative zinc finger protein